MASLNDINQEIDRLVDQSSKDTFNRDSPLHLTTSVEIAKELLLRGANVNARNHWRETPLHYAAHRGKELELVRELLKHGALVNVINKRGYAPLNMATRNYPHNLPVIKELLEYGADIDMRDDGRRNYDYANTSLDFAVRYLPCAKLLIRHTVIKNFNNGYYKKLIDLSPYQKKDNYSELTSYLADCVREIVQMKTDKLKDDITVFDLVTNKLHSIKCNNSLCVKLSRIDFTVRYPIYNDIISDKILERPNLLNKLSKLNFYTKLDILNQDVKEKKIILDPDSTLCITEYLSNAELLNLITAYDDPKQCSSQSLNNLVERDQNFCDTETDNDAKRPRLI